MVTMVTDLRIYKKHGKYVMRHNLSIIMVYRYMYMVFDSHNSVWTRIHSLWPLGNQLPIFLQTFPGVAVKVNDYDNFHMVAMVTDEMGNLRLRHAYLLLNCRIHLNPFSMHV